MTNEQKASEIANKYSGREIDRVAIIEAMKWKDKKNEAEREDLRLLVDMLPIDDRNQTIIEDLKGLLSSIR